MQSRFMHTRPFAVICHLWPAPSDGKRGPLNLRPPETVDVYLLLLFPSGETAGPRACASGMPDTHPPRAGLALADQHAAARVRSG